MPEDQSNACDALTYSTSVCCAAICLTTESPRRQNCPTNSRKANIRRALTSEYAYKFPERLSFFADETWRTTLVKRLKRLKSTRDCLPKKRDTSASFFVGHMFVDSTLRITKMASASFAENIFLGKFRSKSIFLIIAGRSTKNAGMNSFFLLIL